MVSDARFTTDRLKYGKEYLMKYLAIVALIVSAFTACETDEPASETFIIVEEGATVRINEEVAIEYQPDKPISLNRIFGDVAQKRHCRVGDTITLEATVSKGSTAFDFLQIYLETGNDDVEFVVDVFPILHGLLCPDYYKDGETYEFTLFIRAIELYAEKAGAFIREDSPIFEIDALIVFTEKLQKELKEAGCWHPDAQR